MPLFTVETNGNLEPHIKQEWLLTNGLGGFASSTVVGCNTRRYHGVLCAATLPPVGRIMAVNRLGEIITLDRDPDHPLELSINQFRQSYHPRGDQYLRRFGLGETAIWEYDLHGARIIKELQQVWMQNVVMVRYTIQPLAHEPFKFAVLPFVSLRDFHGARHAQDANLRAEPCDNGVVVTSGSNAAHIRSDTAQFLPSPGWWYGHYYAIENERGLDDTEDLFTPGRFEISIAQPTTVTFWLAMDAIDKPDWDGELKRRRDAVQAAHKDPENATADLIATRTASVAMQKLSRAAHDFVVWRKSPDGSDGCTVIAGYPWFADWGRDTMISLPGLFLTSGRFHQARQVLSVFAKYVSEGMIPNRFDDYSNEPHYNTVDASLWFIHAAFEYRRLSNDAHTFEDILLPACRAIREGYTNGTRFHIKMDPADGLICQGDAATQLTWMDAKCNGIAFTPRQGKPVEIQALWHHALVLLGDLDLAAKVRDSFQKQFWISPFRGLYDVVDGNRKDNAIRPNQIFAVSLPNSPLTRDQQLAVVEVVRRELLTPVGLRTLSRSDPNYHGRYIGTQMVRDAAYHNGTVWPWLIGPFLEAYLRVNNHAEDAKLVCRKWLEPLVAQMDTACIGQISEICEGDAPHRPVGCFAQAWSVAEVYRIAAELAM